MSGSELEEDDFERCGRPWELRSLNEEDIEDDVEPRVVLFVDDEKGERIVDSVTDLDMTRISFTFVTDRRLTHRSSTSPSTKSLRTTHGSSPPKKYLATLVSRNNALINATVVACSELWSYPLYA